MMFYINKPDFLGVWQASINPSNVRAMANGSASGEDANLGQLAACVDRYCDFSGHSGIDYYAKEPGTFMLITMLVPEPAYSQGLHPDLSSISFGDDFNPELNGIGFQLVPRHRFSMMPRGFDLTGLDQQTSPWFGNDGTGVSIDPNMVSVGEEVAWSWLRTDYSRLHGDFAQNAISSGTVTGVKLMTNIAAMLLVFISLVALANYITEGVIGRYTGLNDWIVKITDGKAQGLTFQFILGVITSPFMWLIGVPSQDIMLVGSLLGQKTILNEFVAYFQLQQWKDAGLFMYEKSILMSTYILCGFANISSIGILLGGLGVLAPEKRGLISRIGLPAMIGGALVSVLSATIIGMILG